ncbi:MAG: nuclear transport factor 2 family protein [Betaproteobacteria bacterium]
MHKFQTTDPIAADKHQSMAQAVLQAEELRRQALLAGDLECLDALLAPGLVYVHSSGGQDSKASYLEHMRKGSLKYLAMTFDALEAHPASYCCIVTGRMSAEVTRQGQPMSIRSLFMTVWAPAPGTIAQAVWQLQAYQGTPWAG